MKLSSSWLALAVVCLVSVACGGSEEEPVCGNGKVEAGESCDDGNADDTDGCRNTCTAATCGDGIVQAGVEECDDGNDVDTDGCLSTCVAASCGDGVVQAGVETCDDGNDVDTDACPTTCQTAACGDGFVQAGSEECDDGNDVDTDACRNNCVSATCGDGVVHAGVEGCDDGNEDDSDACLSTCVSATCGDGVVQADVEECDDGNADETDACLANCVAARCGDGFVQAGVEVCDDGNTDDTDLCPTTCQPARCGDGFVQEGAEACDDGAANSDTAADACRTNCQEATCGDGTVDSGEPCDDGNDVETDACRTGCIPATCGDGFVQDGVETCDDANADDTDGCPGTCQTATCGDGFVQAGVETCDDANEDDTDGCPGTCQTATCGDGFVQAGVEACDDGNADDGDLCPTTCEIATCGDGFVLAGVEACDDGNDIDTDDCTNACAVAFCGDGIVHEGAEVCDDGNTDDTDACPSTCAAATCGDGFVQAGVETCDDGNANDHDACPASCATAFCGDGFLRHGAEECDDSNTTPGDGCDAACVVEAVPLAVADGKITLQGNIDAHDPIRDVPNANCSPSTTRLGLPYEIHRVVNDGPLTKTITLRSAWATGQGVIHVYTPPFDPAAPTTNCVDGDNGTAAELPSIPVAPGETKVVVVSAYLTSTPYIGAYDLEISTAPICGDGTTSPAEQCDDGNAVNGDGCNIGCVLEPGYSCNAAGTCFPNVCGDSLLGNGEACDDGNVIASDGCSPTCAAEAGFVCESVGFPCRPIVCGDDIVDAGELCEDGNPFSGDGCSSTCQVEGDTCANVAQLPVRSDGTVRIFSNTDGLVGSDYQAGCAITGRNGDLVYAFTAPSAARWTFTIESATFDSALAVQAACGVEASNLACAETGSTGGGDTVSVTLAANETVYLLVDGYGNSTDNEGSFTLVGTSVSTVAVGATCDTAGATSPCPLGSTCDAGTLTCVATGLCGNNALDAGERCDDGNSSGGDGCSADCTIEGGYVCPGGSGCTIPSCGDGVVSSPAGCDDGNVTDGDGCSSTCRVEGNDCTMPWVLTADASNNVTVSSDTNQASPNFELGCSANTRYGRDRVFQFSPPIDGIWTFTITAASYDSALAVFDGCGETSTQLACSEIGTATSNGTDTVTLELRVGETVYLVVDSYASSATATVRGGTFTMASSVLPIVGDGGSCDPSGVANVCDAGLNCSATTLTCTSTVCGNGVIEPAGNEVCDDGNALAGDGCNADCTQVESGFGCPAGGSLCHPIACGDGWFDAGELCEDGNLVSGDGCSANCLPEGDTCADGTVLPVRQDGTVLLHGSTVGQGANYQAGCTPSGRNGDLVYAFTSPTDALWTFTLSGEAAFDPTLSVQTVCGAPTSNLACEDDNGDGVDEVLTIRLHAGETVYLLVDGWSDSTLNEGTFTLAGASTPLLAVGSTCDSTTTELCAVGSSCDATSLVCTATCGNGALDATGRETCDDGNAVAGDGCSAICQIEAGYACPTAGSACRTVSCGDGFVDLPERCDDANTVDGDGCSATCQIEGDTCAAPWLVTGDPVTHGFTVGSTTLGIGADYDLDCTLSSKNGDRFFEYTAPVRGNYRFEVSGSFDTALGVMSTCGDPTTELACVETGSAGAVDAVTMELQQGQTVYVVVDGYGTTTVNEGTFTLVGSVQAIVDLGGACDPAGVTSVCAFGGVCDQTANVCVATVCGNGVPEPNGGEECDDGNQNDHDACSNNCFVRGENCNAPFDLRLADTNPSPTGFAASGDLNQYGQDRNPSCYGSITATGDYRDVVYAVSGNGTHGEHWTLSLANTSSVDLVLDIASSCDTRNTRIACSANADDATAQTLSFYLGANDTVYVWVDSETTTASSVRGYTLTGTVLPTVAVGGACDVTGAADRCDEGADCVGGTCVASTCGNGTVESGEECDDGNTVDNDGCSNFCYRVGDTCNAPYDLIALNSSTAPNTWEHAGNLTSMTPTYQGSCDATGGYNDAVYSFTAPTDGTYTFTETSSFSATIYANDICPSFSGNDLACVASTSDTFTTTLEAGKTIYIFVDPTGSTAGSTVPSTVTYVLQAVRAP